MGAKTALTVEQYLRTSFPDLDKEYRDGELVERSLPDYLHSKTQGLLILLLGALRKTFPVYVCPELRVQVRTGLIRIPDISVYYPDEPKERY
jgi:Uma2 family endonuclease